MTNPSVLLELAGRVEALTGASREVDGEIDRLFHDRPKNGDYDAGEHAIWRIRTGYGGLLVRGDGFARGSFCAAAFTASIDAAMTLVPVGWVWTVNTFADPSRARSYCMNERNEQVHHAPQFVATPALALTAACLRALAAREG